jgi:hypothetical protein
MYALLEFYLGKVHTGDLNNRKTNQNKVIKWKRQSKTMTQSKQLIISAKDKSWSDVGL